MDIGKAFSYVFEDENWLVKVLIGGVLSLIPIVNFIVLGYVIQALRNVADGVEKPLPEWDDWGGYFMKGLMLFLGGLVYSIPLILLVVVSFVAGLIGAGAEEESALSSLAGLCVGCSNCLIWIYALFLNLWLPAVATFYAVYGEFGAMFRFGELFNYIIGNIGNYLIAFVLYLVASFIASLGIILCVIGVAFTSFWAYLVAAHLYGQVWKASQAVPTTA